MKYKVGSLFAGVGGICLGFKQAQFKENCYEMQWANEIDKYACLTYKNNFEHDMFEGDINHILEPENSNNEKYYTEIQKKILNSKIDVLTGGFPCQAFSIAGERRGFEDERGNLFLSIVKLVKMLGESAGKPEVLFLENVKNLLAHDKGKTYKIIKEEIEKLGYHVHEQVLNTMEYTNIPQNRERIYIVCFKSEEKYNKFRIRIEKSLEKYNFTKEQRAIQVGNILDEKVDNKYSYTKEKYPNYFKDVVDDENVINLDMQINEENQFYQLRRGMYVRKNQSNVCPTLTANMGTGGHNVPLIYSNNTVRKLTPSETFKLQGFPVGKGYELPMGISDSHLYKQAGNAVTVPMVKLLAIEILKVLED